MYDDHVNIVVPCHLVADASAQHRNLPCAAGPPASMRQRKLHEIEPDPWVRDSNGRGCKSRQSIDRRDADAKVLRRLLSFRRT